MEKKIGIIGTQTKDMFGVSTKYMEWASQFGEVVILSPHADFDPSIDLLILQGGADIDPSTYGKKPFFNLTRSNPYFEYFDNMILPDYVKNKTPIFGICRGMQAINVAFGGTLKNVYTHPTNDSDDRKEKKHFIRIMIVGQKDEVVKVNSLHHQVIDEIPDELEIIALHCNDKGNTKPTIEAIAHQTLPICGVQYHPEEIHDKFAISLVEELLEDN